MPTDAPPTPHRNPAGQLAVALDFSSAAEALACVDRLEGTCEWVKVGMELFYAAGSRLLGDLRRRNLRIFLDLKLHDIPNTVAGAVRSVSSLGVDLLTLHAVGGPAMLQAAADAAASIAHSPRLLAVTVLTSMNEAQLSQVGVPSSPSAQVLRLARIAASCGIAGLVCSAEETALLRRELAASTFLVVPGIRPFGTMHHDQHRVASPGEAIARGASLLVVGRPITQSADPAATARAILHEIAAAPAAPQSPS